MWTSDGSKISTEEKSVLLASIAKHGIVFSACLCVRVCQSTNQKLVLVVEVVRSILAGFCMFVMLSQQNLVSTIVTIR